MVDLYQPWLSQYFLNFVLRIGTQVFLSNDGALFRVKQPSIQLHAWAGCPSLYEKDVMF